MFKTNQRFEVGDRVRRKLNKGKLDKASAPSWSAEIYRVTGGIGKRGSVAEKFAEKIGCHARASFSIQ